ncbi:multidrug resistance-associated protein 2 [Pyricularia oryzae]|nr:multidrug resistance-associated protein 2 [Pyricularia oryzae]
MAGPPPTHGPGSRSSASNDPDIRRQTQDDSEQVVSDATMSRDADLIRPSAPSPAPKPSADLDDATSSDEEKHQRQSSSESLSLPATATRNGLNRTKSTATDVSATYSTHLRTLQQEWTSRPWYRKLNPLRWGGIPPLPDERAPCPEVDAGFLSKLLFSWQGPLMKTGYRRSLQLTDIWAVNPDRAVEPMSDRVRASFKKRVAAGQRFPLALALHEAFFREFWLGGFCSLISTLMQVLSPFMLRFLIQFATDAYNAANEGAPAPPVGRGAGLIVGVVLMQIAQSLAMNHFIYHGMICGGQSRATLIQMVYEKSMVLSGRAKAGGSKDNNNETKDNKENKDKKKKGSKGGVNPEGQGAGWANGRIVNLMSVDTYRVDQAFGLFHIIWTAPLACIITLIVLVINITYSALAGFALLVIGVPILTRAIKSLFIRRKGINRITDQRVSLTQEILQSVRFVKYFGWESSFIARLHELRAREISAIQMLLSIRNAILAVSLSLPIFASMLSFITYSLSGHGLNPAQIFSSLALFNGLRMPLNLLPLVIGQITDGWSSLKRVEEFLLAEEQNEDVVRRMDGENAIEMHGASFTWEKSPTQKKDGEKEKKPVAAAGKEKPAPENGDGTADGPLTETEREPFHLEELNLAIGRNELIAVIGTVGSGKSSLLAALAGDMRKTAGEVVLGALRAFCPQYSWIQNTTVRDNILFGKEMDESWYREVIKACALEPDLDMLPNGDLTEIGERGITISGGQKQRLNIARAIYFDADMVLMDDPLSAVDAHVGRHIFDNAILGLLGDKCRILATHQLWVLNRCDRIVWMEAGKIQAVGTFDDLVHNHEGFKQLMETHALEEKKDGKKADDESAGDGEDTKDAKEKQPGDIKLKKGKSLMQTEEQAVASVPWSVYDDYIRSSGSILNAPLTIALLLVAQGANIATALWLSYWTSDRFSLPTPVYIGIYAGLAVAQVVLLFGFMVALSVLGTRASRTMLHQAVTRVLRAPMSFFDTTPLGRITNRFSRDVDVMDNNLADAMRMYFFSVSGILSTFALIIAFFHYFAAALVPLFFVFLASTAYYRASAREVKRFESTLRSTLFAKFSEGLSGVACIRAYGLQDRFAADLRAAIDDMNSAYYLTFSNQRWLSIRLDAIGNALVLTTGVLVVTNRFDVPPSIGGLVLSYILSIVQMIQFTVRQLAEVENGMNAVERLRYYGRELESEAPLKTIEVAPSWPQKGEIIFEDVEMRYRPGLLLVLRGLDMKVRGGERIGIVGRTGAGKSSIMSALFRLVELSGGRITIDGLDIATVGLGDLRSRLAIIPQDPTLFKGTVRSNLDPFGEHTDLELWDALRQADLVGPETGSGTGTPTAFQEKEAGGGGGGRIQLDTVVEEDGLNFSLGQRQLMALARALVRGSQIIICDEATSSVDMETDAKIQATMAVGFRGKTLLCIAHRLRTIVGYDRICVMDQGRIAELGEPAELFKMEGGIFRGMCERSGIGERDILAAREGLGIAGGVDE